MKSPIDTLATLQWSPDSRCLMIRGSDGSIRLWDVSSLTSPIRPIKLNVPYAYHDGWWNSPDGKQMRMLEGSEKGTVRVLDVLTGKDAAPSLATNLAVAKAAFSPDGRRVLIVGGPLPPPGQPRPRPAEARVWDVATGQPITPPLTHPKKPVTAAFSPDGRHVVTRCTDGLVRVWDAGSGDSRTPFLEHKEEVRHASISPDGRLLVTIAGSERTSIKNGEGRLWEVNSGQPLHAPFVVYRNSEVVFSPDSRFLFVQGEKVSHLLNTSTSALVPLQVEMGTVDPISGMKRPALVRGAFRPDSRAVVVVGPSFRAALREESVVAVLDVETGKPLFTPLKIEVAKVEAVFSPDGRRLLAFGRVWDATSGEALTPVSGSAWFSPDGRWVLAYAPGSDRGLRLCDAGTGQPLTPTFPGAVFPHVDGVTTVWFSPDQRRLLLRDGGGGLRTSKAWLWELPDDARPVEDLSMLAQLLSGRRIDRSGALEWLSLADLDSYWNSLQKKYVTEFRRDPTEVLAWQERVAEAAEKSRDWLAARHHLDPLIAARPDDLQLIQRRIQACEKLRDWARLQADYTRLLERDPHDWRLLDARGIVLAERHDWEKAADDFARAVKIEGATSPVWRHQALVQLQSGDREAYRETCTELFEGPRKSVNVPTAHHIARTCILAPDAIAEPANIVELAQGPADKNPKSAEYLATLAAALYRAGKHAEARDLLVKVVSSTAGSFGPLLPSNEPTGSLFLAMAHQRLGETELALQRLAQAARWMETMHEAAPRPVGSLAPLPPVPWEKRMELQLLYREAEERILAGPKEPKDISSTILRGSSQNHR